MSALAVFFGLVVAAGAGFVAAWLIRQSTMEKNATYTSSLEQLVAGLMRERDVAIERERSHRQDLERQDSALVTRARELERELEHRETQTIAFRDEAIQLARAREEVAQRLAWQERQAREVEAALRERIQELEANGARGPGNRPTMERELDALVAAHETDLAELEAQYLALIQSKDAEIERLRTRQESAPASSPVPAERMPTPAAETSGAPLEAPASGNGEAPISGAGRARHRRRRSRDDLKQIDGIDESLEQALHLVGVTSFRQVARWKEKDIDRMARKLYQSADRIRDERWVEKAREAYQRKYGGIP